METTTATSIGQRFKQVRKELGFTQQEFAAELNISQVAVYKMEEGQIKSVSPEVTQMLEHKFGINKVWLHFGEGMMYHEDKSNMQSLYNKLDHLTRLTEKVLSELRGEPLPQKKKRGRPPLPKAEVEGPKRKRGRPRIKPIPVSTGEKRGPGRPPKAVAAVATTTVKRKPGRPAKNAAPVVEKRSPGRPRKLGVPTTTGRRGRPPKGAVKPTEVATKSATTKRGPGRPKKSA